MMALITLAACVGCGNSNSSQSDIPASSNAPMNSSAETALTTSTKPASHNGYLINRIGYNIRRIAR